MKPVGQIKGEPARLLAALSAPDSYAVSDPTEPGRVIVRVSRNGISVGAGRYKLASAEALAAQDLARVTRSEAGQRRFRLTEAGRAHLRRAGALQEEAFQVQHREMVQTAFSTEDGPVKANVNASESPLAWLRRRRNRAGETLIDARAFEAGERLRRDLTLAGMLPSVTARWDGAIGGAGGKMRDPASATDAMVAARQRVRSAMDAVGTEFAGLLVDLCGFLKGLEAIEQERGWPVRSAKVVVQMALARLADHYGYGPVAEGPAASGRIRTWRPVLIEGGRPV